MPEVTGSVRDMKSKKILVIKLGQKLLNKRRKTVFTVRNIEENSVVLVSEDGSKKLTGSHRFHFTRGI